MSRQKFVLVLGRAMHALGSPSYRVEDAMVACSRAMGLDGSFFATPTALFAAIGEPGEEGKTILLRVVPGDHDLGRLAQLYGIRDRVVKGELPPEQGLIEVEAVLAAGGREWPVRDLCAQTLVGGGAAALLGGGAAEVAVGSIAGMLAGLIGLIARRRPSLGDVQAALTCALVAFFVRSAGTLWLPIHVPLTTVAAVIVLLPGLSFTTALAELSMRHLAAGSARLMGTLAVFVTMAIGVGLGDTLAVKCFGAGEQVLPTGLSDAWLVASLAANWLAFAVLLRATSRQAPWVLLAVLAGYGGARFGGAWLGGELGVVIGAMAVSALGNLYARWLRQPAAVVRTPGLLLLVPGSLGLSGLTTALSSGDFAASAPFAFRMLLIGGAIVAGLLFAGVVLPPPLDVEPDSRRGMRP